MKQIKFFLLILSSAFIISCDSDNACDNSCATDEVLLLDCRCARDANTIVPHPCPDLTCPSGQVLTVEGTICQCQDLMNDPCSGVECPDGTFCDNGDCIPESSTVIDVSGNITSDQTWTADNIYILKDRVTVTAGATLNIEAGTIVKGEAGSGANASALLIARGAQLNARGTANAPIIFTSIADEIMPGQIVGPNLDPVTNGFWGGVIILGNAPISASNDAGDVTEVQIEGIPTSDPNGLYGGNDPNDNSGTIQYISIRHGGSNIGEGNEINGLTLGGVGAGTTIENVEVVANQDDGIEWFGGTVDVSNVLVWNSFDDALDTDQAWNGNCTNFIVVTPISGSAFELDGPEGSLTQGPNNFSNGVVFVGDAVDHIIDWDGGTNTGISDLYIFGIDPSYDAALGIESFGGDGTGTTGSWQYTAPAGYDVATLFADVPAAELTEVPQNGNSVGPNSTGFEWTWAAASGALSGIGL